MNSKYHKLLESIQLLKLTRGGHYPIKVKRFRKHLKMDLKRFQKFPQIMLNYYFSALTRQQ